MSDMRSNSICINIPKEFPGLEAGVDRFEVAVAEAPEMGMETDDMMTRFVRY
jgi:hypothetical protein